jgi:Glycosyltransferase
MRVLILTADIQPQNWSGIGTAVTHQVHALAQLGVEAHILTFEDVSGPTPIDQSGGIIIHTLCGQRCPIDPADFDVIHLHSLSLSELAFEMRRRFKVPLIYTAHSLLCKEVQDPLAASFWIYIQMFLLHTSDFVIFVNSADRTEALQMIPDLVDRSGVIPNGLSSVSSSLRRLSTCKQVIFAGRFAHKKGIDLLAQIVERLQPHTNLRFIFAGGHGDPQEEKTIQELAARYPQTCSHVGWLARESLKELFAQAALVLVPSEYEPFGMVALEAMSVGTPVLAADVGGLREVVRPGSGGRLVSSRDAHEWSCAILEVLEIPSLWAELSQRGPQYVTTHYNHLGLARQLIDNAYRPAMHSPYTRRRWNVGDVKWNH